MHFINDTVINEKFKNIEKRCDNLYEQITELRTIIQDMYGEIAESNRFYSAEMIRISERIEAIAKEFNKISNTTTNVTISPKINPYFNSNQNPSIDIKTSRDPDDGPLRIGSFIKDNLPSIVIASIIGFLFTVGTIIFLLMKVLDIIK